LVIGDAAIAEPSMGHNGIETGIGHGNTAAAAWGLGAVDECIYSSVSSVLLLNLCVAQVLFVGSVPRINCLPIIKSIYKDSNKGVSLLSHQLPYTL
jgi:hypothetical protein